MKLSHSTILGILILISSCTSHSDKEFQKFTLQGQISGQDTGSIVLTYWSDNARIYDTTRIKNGRFIFTGKIVEPISAVMSGRNDSDRVFIYIEPNKMKISVSKGNFEECIMTGSKTQDDAVLLSKMEKPIHERFAMLRDQKNKISESIKKTLEDSSKMLFEKKAEEINMQWTQNKKKLDSIKIKFVIDNPKSFLSVAQLEMLGSNEVVSLDSTKSIFNGLDITLKESSNGKNILDEIRKKENVQIGAKVPDINIKDINNQTITFSQFRDKNVVLIDFWASWCVPCRESFPHLREIYSQYHPQGLEIIAIAWLDKNKETWIEAINQEKLITGIMQQLCFEMGRYIIRIYQTIFQCQQFLLR
ncbi:MAG: AhpC/TSA family protein [Bacteroidales bacterium]|nr:AhpC/TSA family protein [Bacteroidales bacterium]